tara:strand:+ start:6248 stop:6934 length:687 start_codon:yes stop_codon:yes gene_type:complete
MLNVDKIYVLHYTKLTDRKVRLDRYFDDHNIEVEYITDYDQEVLTEEMISESYECDEGLYNSKIPLAYGSRSEPFRELNLAEISCTFKHRLAIEKIAKECPRYGLILEDDAMLREPFEDLFNTFISQTPRDWDAIFMGCCAGLHVPEHRLKEGVVAYQMQHPASRGGDSYLLTRLAASKISNTMKTFTTISDWELGYQIYKHDLTTYWWEPPLVVQGSESGLYKSSLR